MKILVTSSTGLTGKAVVRHLADKGAFVRAMVHSDRKKEEMLNDGAAETTVASIENGDDLKRSMTGMDAVFYICPTAHPNEGEIGKMAVRIAEECGIGRFVYQSVHNSIEPELPHHRQKLMVEQALLDSSLEYIILRPTAFMQNLLPSIVRTQAGYAFNQRFYKGTDAENRINLIDADDYAEIASKVSLGKKYSFANFDLCGPQNLSASDMMEAIRTATGHDVDLRYLPDEPFTAMSRSNGMPEAKIETLVKMFRSYNEHGFKGNPYITASLLGHLPKNLLTFLSENFKD